MRTINTKLKTIEKKEELIIQKDSNINTFVGIAENDTKAGDIVSICTKGTLIGSIVFNSNPIVASGCI